MFYIFTFHDHIWQNDASVSIRDLKSNENTWTYFQVLFNWFWETETIRLHYSLLERETPNYKMQWFIELELKYWKSAKKKPREVHTLICGTGENHV